MTKEDALQEAQRRANLLQDTFMVLQTIDNNFVIASKFRVGTSLVQTFRPEEGVVRTAVVKDQAFALHDGFYCIVGGRVFGPWLDIGLAQAGMEVEQRRAAKREGGVR